MNVWKNEDMHSKITSPPPMEIERRMAVCFFFFSFRNRPRPPKWHRPGFTQRKTRANMDFIPIVCKSKTNPTCPTYPT